MLLFYSLDLAKSRYLQINVKREVLTDSAAGIVRGYQTGDVNEALDAIALAGNEGFEWGAITDFYRYLIFQCMKL